MAISRRELKDSKLDDLEKEIAELEKQSEQTNENTEGVVKEETTNKVEDLPLPKTSEEETYKKRYGDLRRHSQKIEQSLNSQLTELRNEVEKLRNAPTSIPTSEDQIKEWANKNPQAAAIIRAIAKEQAGDNPQLRELKAEMAEIEELKVHVNQDRIRAKVLKAHPDYDDVVDDAFHDWAESQPKLIQDIVYDNPNADDTIWAISLYKKEKGITPKDPERDAARAVKTPGAPKPTPEPQKGRWTESKVQALSIKDFEKFQEEIEQEARTNPSFYDLSGGAR